MLPKVNQYVIEAAGYEMPTPTIISFSLKPTPRLLQLLPGHLFLSLSKQQENGDLMPISSLQGLATRIHDEKGDAKKEILPIGNQTTDKLVLYHIFNNRGYLEQIKAHPENQTAILQQMGEDKERVGLTEQEDQENRQITQDHGDLYWLSLNKRRTVYGTAQGEDHALELWKILNDFKSFYNQHPNVYPHYGLGFFPLIGKAPLNSNAAFTTFSYLAGVPVDGFPHLWTPGLGGLLRSTEELQPWLKQCQAIQLQEEKTQKNRDFTVTSSTGSSQDPNSGDASLVKGYGASFFQTHVNLNNGSWDPELQKKADGTLNDSSYYYVSEEEAELAKKTFAQTRQEIDFSDDSSYDDKTHFRKPPYR